MIRLYELLFVVDWAALNGRKEIVELLIEKKADANLKNEFNKAEKKSPMNSLNEKNEIQLFVLSHPTINLFSSILLIANNLKPDHTFHLSDKHLASIFHPPQA